MLKYKLSALALLGLTIFVLLGLGSEAATGATTSRGKSANRASLLTPTPTCDATFVHVSSPSIEPGDSYLNAITVVEADDAWSVGSYSTGPTGGTLTEHWDGTQWAIVPSPNASEGHNGLLAVSGVSSDDIWAVGHANTADMMQSHKLIEHWDGTQWSIVPSPDIGTGDSMLYGVEAVALNDVWAVGYYYVELTEGSRTLTLHWDGVQWSVVPSPNGTLIRSNALQSISALTSGDIWAVGYFMGDDTEALIEHWDGTQWSIVPAASPGAGSKQLNSVHAISPDNVWSVGQYYTASAGVTRYLIEHWNGTQWSVIPGPNLGPALSSLMSVSGLTADDVWAVGLLDFNPFHTLVVHWNGTQWGVVPSWSPSTGSSSLHGVFASRRDQVWAIGVHGEVGSQSTLIEAYNNRCTTTTPVPVATSTPTSTTTSTAVNGPPTQTATRTPSTPAGTPTGLATSAASAIPSRTWTATTTTTQTPTCAPAWAIASNPEVGSLAGRLKAVTALSQDDIWAAGTKGGTSGPGETVIEHWDGAVWRVVSSPNVALSNNALEGLAAVRTDDVWAVGYAHDGSVSRTLIMHWNGIVWSIVPSPNVGLDVNVLTSVTAVADDDIWAVGYSSSAGGPTRTLILHWDGAQWTVSPSPNVGAEYNQLYGVDARARNDVWAVGSGPYSTTTGIGYTLILHWDGISWSIIPSPRPGVASFLQDVTVVDASSVWAVGSYRGGGEGPYSSSLILHWDGTNWNVVPSPSPGASLNYLNGVSALSSDDIWAVGEVDRQTFTLHWNGVQWAAVASPNIGVSSNNLYDIAAIASNDVWAVGEYYSVERQTWRPLVEQYTDPCVCYMQFTDVRRDSTFYPFVRCLACRGILSGYADGTFRPNSDVTRGQLAKIVSNAAGFSERPDPQIFEDVPSSNIFYEWINRLAVRGYMSGYVCGAPGEPCTTGMPYFRPSANATRGQTSKIVSNSAGYTEEPTEQTFEDVPPTYTFYREIQRLASRGIMGGYPCGGPGEPCLSGKPYFRPQNNVTRGQSAKIVANTFYRGCDTP